MKCRLAGADLMGEILRMANKRGLGVCLVANSDGLSGWKETAEAIKRMYPDIRTGGIDLVKNDPNYKLQITNYSVIFCNFGAPFQEKFLHSLKQGNYGNIRLAMGVGGSFDFWVGKQRRAPLWMRNYGLEWLFRLWKQPGRFRRIFRAVIIFPIKVIAS